MSAINFEFPKVKTSQPYVQIGTLV